MQENMKEYFSEKEARERRLAIYTEKTGSMYISSLRIFHTENRYTGTCLFLYSCQFNRIR